VHVDSRLYCSDIATHSMLGGQHGEESKVKDQVSGQKDCKKDDEAPQEEVMLSLRSLGSEGCRRLQN
jgi:hypothetical protein